MLTFADRASPTINSMADVMNTNFKSSPRLASVVWSSVVTVSTTLACSEEPTWPAARRVSMSLFTASRISRMRPHLASSAMSGAASAT